MNSVTIEQNKQELIHKRKKNARLFPIYKMFSWDLLFYYAISFIFLTQTKGLSIAAVMLTDALFPIFKSLFQIPADMVIDNLGKRKSLILANSCLSIAILILLVSNGIASVILSYLIQSFGFAIKGVAETNLLYDSITIRKGKNTMYTKLDEKGSSNYYRLHGISSLLTGFLFVINGYVPMLICLMFTVIAIALSSCFKDVYPIKKSASLMARLNTYKEQLTGSADFIFHSQRLKALMLFMIFFSGILYISYTLREGLLSELNVSAQYFAVIISVLTFISGVTTLYSDKIQQFLKNKTLTVFSVFWIISFISIGIITMTPLSSGFKISIVLIIFLLHYMIQGPYYTLYSRYQKSFASPNMRIKIASTFNTIESLAQGLMAFLTSIILEIIDIKVAFLLIGIIASILLFVILKYMKPRIGLKPEQYSKQDIEVLNPKLS